MLKVVCKLMVFIVITYILAYGQLAWTNHEKSHGELIQLNKWEFMTGDSLDPSDRKSFKDLSLLPGVAEDNSIYWIRTKLPDAAFRDPSLYILIFGKYEVYLEENLIYRYGVIDPAKESSFYNTPPRLISLPEDAGGKTIHTRVQSLRDPIGPRGSVWLGESSNIILHVTKQESLQIQLSMFYLFIGLISLILFLRLKNQPILLSFTWVSFCVGVYLLARTSSKDFFFDHPSLWAFIECISLSLMVAGFLHFLSHVIHPYKSKLVHYSSFGCVGFTIVIAFLILFTDASLKLVFTSLQIVVFAGAILTTVSLLQNAYYHRNVPKNLYMAISLLAVCAIHDTLSHSLLWNIQLRLFLPGLLMFLLILMVVLYQKLSHQWEEYAHDLESKNAALNQLNQFKNQVLTNTSHELRTPLHGIIGLAQVLLSQVEAGQRRNLELIIKSGKRLSHLINDILDINRLEHNQFHLQPSPFHLRTTVDHIFQLLEPIKKNGVVFINEVPDLCIIADENRMLQILSNLIGNAAKFTTHGSIRVTAELNKESKDQLVLKVEDTGPGISPEQLQYIFKEFYVPTSIIMDDNKMVGSGLGLAITKRLVEVQGGSITAQSTIGVGTTFTCELPIPIVEDFTSQSENLDFPYTPPVYFTEIPKYKASLLIVDDEDINRLVIQGALQSIDQWDLHFASTAEQALSMAHAIQPDLIILDIMLPDLDGFELCRQLRENPPVEDMKILILTARGFQDAHKGYEAGADEYLQKPADPVELVYRISAHLQARWFLRKQKHSVLTERQIRFLELAYQHPQSCKEELADMMFIKYETLKKDVLKINQHFNSRTYMEAALQAKKQNFI
ncbi:histidine kinase [Paenibacillus mucilaginosus K02]|uniref:histidine kinase n=2 Tax=Paenibacillus mucilaginosus TaxID=61624 RepID=I0BTC9_9BACL|nr:histidine kinase [Paenibacillus mucilaginosus K02]